MGQRHMMWKLPCCIVVVLLIRVDSFSNRWVKVAGPITSSWKPIVLFPKLI